MLSIKVTVTNIASIYDQESRTRGREIILDEYKEEKMNNTIPMGISPDFINDLMKNISQTFGFSAKPSQKIILKLSDEEYESLGIKFEVNDVYIVTFNEGKIEFSREHF
ncbi:MAG: arcadin 1 [Thermoplasmata archaeon]